MADVDASLYQWSTTESSNKPSGSTSIATGLDDNLRTIQAVTRAWLAHKGSDVASATTTDIGAVSGSFNDVTGSTTITGLGTVSAGIHKWIKFEGALTLTHNATSLILPGGANITTADGDVAWFISEGSGNWRCLSYMKANGSLPHGGVIQRVYAETATRTTSNTAIPADNSVPQSGEGVELLTASITPRSASSRIRVRFNGYFGNNAGGSSQLVVALFRDAGADAKKAVAVTGASGDIETVTLEFEESSAAATSTTYKIRFGPSSAAGSGWAANGGAAANLFGAVDLSTLVLEEVV
jgi:hypothetical protein